jgi:hypothetical protein
MRRDRLDLFAASFLMLLVELVLIRWTGAWIVHLSYFANFVLLGSFLGVGIGFLRARKGPDLFRWSPIVLAFLIGAVIAFPAQIDRTGGDLVYFGVQARGLPAWVLLPFVFAATALCMACIAHGVAVRFAKFAALEAYRLDILGSLAGIITFSVVTFLGWGPFAWGGVIVGLYILLLRRPSLVQAAGLFALASLFVIGVVKGNTIWSPYYRIVVSHSADTTAIDANGVPHQAAIVTTGSEYEVPYQRLVTKPQSVLVIGAGNGNDVAVALREGAIHVDAVEIDPELLKLGVQYHPEHPYADPRVTQIVDDGRAFLGRTTNRYDLIVFALPDSLTLVSGQSSVRLESYLFTKEAIQAAADHLTAGGSFAMYNFYREQWLADRLGGTLEGVFGQAPCFDVGADNGGDVGRLTTFVASSNPSALRCDQTWVPEGREVVAPATDDHPFVYLRGRTIPSRYVLSILLILLGSLVTVRLAGGRIRPLVGYMDLFCMGAAFLLIETKSVVQFALLFGTTWFVNALVFTGVLLSVLLAIEVERKVRIGRPLLLLGAVLSGLVVAGLVPSSALLELGVIPRFFAAVGLAFFPIFAANLLFAERFRDAPDPTAAFGANLLGAMVGGAIEYLSLLTGYRALLVIAAALYLLAYATSPLRRSRPPQSTAALPRDHLVSPSPVS